MGSPRVHNIGWLQKSQETQGIPQKSLEISRSLQKGSEQAANQPSIQPISKPASQPAGQSVNMQACKPVNMQTCKPNWIDFYTREGVYLY